VPPSRTPITPGRDFVRLLWRQPLFAIPFALFFGTLFGRGMGGYLAAFKVSLVFTYVVGLGIWTVCHFLIPRLTIPENTRGVWIVTSIYTGASFLGTYVAAILVHFWVVPGFMGSGRSIAVMTMFSLLFAALAMGIAIAAAFYQKAMAQAKSEQELNLARRIQRSFLLSQFPERPRLEVHAVNVSSKEVSGDFYDVVPAAENVFLLAIADVAGKGVPAALLSSMLQASLRTQAHQVPSAAAILGNINTLVYRSTSVHQFATFFLARVEEDRMRLAYSNAGHNYPIVFRQDGRIETLEKGGTVVGILESAAFEEEEIALQPGDRLVFYTDGISEAANAKGELFGEDRLCRLVTGLPADLTARETTERILDDVRGFLDGVEAGDDMTVMVLRVLGDGVPGTPVTARAGKAPGSPPPRAL
jgi:serine phosphatase RsbU (regulator of sigma subunit)